MKNLGKKRFNAASNNIGFIKFIVAVKMLLTKFKNI